jgi:hypothetical protein
MGNRLLKKVLDHARVKNVVKLLKMDVNVEVEPPLHHEEKRNYCDIKIMFRKNRKPRYLFFIEIKISTKALQPEIITENVPDGQLDRQVSGFKQYYRYHRDKYPRLVTTFLFLTPDDPSFDLYFAGAKKRLKKGEKITVSHLAWCRLQPSTKQSLYDMIQQTKLKNGESFMEMIIQPFLEFIQSDFYPITFRKGKSFKNRVKEETFVEFSKAITNSVLFEMYSDLQQAILDSLAAGGFPVHKNPIISNRRETMMSFSVAPAAGNSRPLYYVRIHLTRSRLRIRLNTGGVVINSSDLSKRWKKDSTKHIYEASITEQSVGALENVRSSIIHILNKRVKANLRLV